MLGEPRTHIFPVEIESKKTVGALKDAIKAKNPLTFQRVEAKELVLWKVSIPDDGNLQKNLDKCRVDFIDEKSLSPTKDLSELFSDTPIKQHIQVIIKAPPSSSAVKHADGEEKDIITTLRTSALLLLTSFANSNFFYQGRMMLSGRGGTRRPRQSRLNPKNIEFINMTRLFTMVATFLSNRSKQKRRRLQFSCFIQSLATSLTTYQAILPCPPKLPKRRSAICEPRRPCTRMKRLVSARLSLIFVAS